MSADDTKDIECKQEFEEDMMASAMTIAQAMSGDAIKELLSTKGPTVQAILLKTDGTAEQVLYDSTPSKNHIATIIGCSPTIIGQYADLDVIVVGSRCEESDATRNKHKLRYPFNNDTYYGNIFLYRFDQDCVMQHFTLKEYTQFAAKAKEDIGKVFKPLPMEDNTAYDNEEYSEEEYESEDDEDYDEMEELQHILPFVDKEQIMALARQEYIKDTGEEPTEDMLESALKMFEANEEKQSDCANEEEMAKAIENVQNCAKQDQVGLVQKISATFSELNGRQPTQEELSKVFASIKQGLTEEAHASEEENDSDYKPEAEDSKMESEKVKILVTPIKRKPSGSRMGVYLKENSDEKKKLEFASDRFEKINGRKPTENDTKRLKDFLRTEMLFETEVEVDEDYVPEKDIEDYSKDIEDEVQFEKEVKGDITNEKENDNTANVNID